MKNKLPVLSFFIVFITLALTVTITYEAITKTVINSKIQNKKTIIIDAGHGGFDSGAQVADGTHEKDINLKISKNLKDFLEYFNFNVIMTRETDISVESDNGKKSKKSSDLYNRLNTMKENPDAIFVSIHMNKFTSSNAVGAQVFYAPKVPMSDLLADSIQSTIKQLLQPQNERVIKKGTKSIYILNNATIPATIVECGFMSNQKELSLLKDENYQKKMAFSILCGIISYHNSF